MGNSETERLARSEERHTPISPSPADSGEYSLEEKVYEGVTSLVYRAHRKNDNQPVILKMLKEPHPAPAHIERLQSEYALLSGLQGAPGSQPALEGVGRVYGLETVQRCLTMVLEDFSGESLTRLHLAGKLDLADYLQLAIKITGCLDQIHQRCLIHKNITPSNIVLNAVTGQVKIIDFGLATFFTSGQSPGSAATLLEGTPAYISPEQTGRIQREVDYRADLYSLGITLYEVLTGHVPFEGQDALEVVYSHLARQPVAPHEANPFIPRPLSELVLKLLAKNPDHRYQTAFGLKADLERCLQQWNMRGSILPFSPAAHAAGNRFIIPQQAYGRAPEIAAPLETDKFVGSPPSFAGHTEVHLNASDVDLATLLKTAQAISAEAHLADVLQRLLRFAIENAGAEKGILLLEERGNWVIGARGEAGSIVARLEQTEHLEAAEEAPAEVIQHVARTREAVILKDAAHAGTFTQAPYIIKNQCASIMCVPLLHQGQVSGMLYLENNLTPGAFTEARLDVLRWLSAQMALSIDNARLHQDLNRAVVAHEGISEHQWAEHALREAIDAAEVAQQEAEIAKHQEEKRRQEAEQRRQIAESLRDILSILNSNRPFDEVLNYIVSQGVRLLGSQAAAVYSRHGEAGEVVIQAEQGLPSLYLASVKLLEHQQALKRAMLHPQPVAIPDLTFIPTSKDHPEAEQELVVLPALLAPYHALLGVPIVIKNAVYGHVRLYYKEPRAFSKEEIELAIMFSDQVALAIENARLRDQVKQAAVIDERHRLARDLHDAVTQTIMSANMIAEALPRIWERRPEEGRRSLEELHRLTQGALAEMRTLLLELRPAAIIEKNLGELLKQLIETATSQTQTAATLMVEGNGMLPVDVQIALYRIAQEVMNNILKHARASQIRVRLQYQQGRVILRLSDNGRGFDPGSIRPDQMGVNIMRERAMNIGATFKLTSRPERGTYILVIWPESGVDHSNETMRPK